MVNNTVNYFSPTTNEAPQYFLKSPKKSYKLISALNMSIYTTKLYKCLIINEL
jgi:hypothetical protein